MKQLSPSLLSRSLLALTVYLLGMQSLPAQECSRRLSGFHSLQDLDSSSRSLLSRSYWATSRRTRPLVYSEWAAQTNVEYLSGLPTYESRPTKLGFTDWVYSFGRAHPLHPELMAEAKKQMDRASVSFRELMDRVRRSPNDELEDELASLAAQVQYYHEMQQALSGEILPFAEQGPSVLDRFLLENGGGSEIHLHEAHIRLWEAESKLTAQRGLDASGFAQMLLLQREIHFYKEAIQKISDNINSQVFEKPHQRISNAR